MNNTLIEQFEQYPEEHRDRLLAAMAREAKRIFAEEPGAGVSLNGYEVAGHVPKLPTAARLSDEALTQAEGAGQWLTAYTDYAVKRSPMTPRTFHEAGGLWLGSVAIARRLYCPLPHAHIWPNVYVLWVASTTLFAKSTALQIVEELAHAALNHLLLPQEFTPEALLSELAGKDPPGMDDLPDETRELWRARRNFAAQRGLVADEFSGLLASARKDYNAGLTETILRLHDCPPQWEKRTQTHGLVRVRNAYLSILSATTPSALGPFVARGAWMSGFWPRFALLSPEEDRPAFRRAEKQPRRPEAMVEHLSWLACKALSSPTYPNPPEARPVHFTDDALDAWRRFDRAVRYDLLTGDLDESLWGLYGRLPSQGVKVATILAALDWDGEGQPVIEVGHWARAQQIVESWRASVHRLLVPARVQAEQRQEERILNVIRGAGQQGVTLRDIYRPLGVARDEVEPIVRNLVQDGLVTETHVKTTSQGGRPTMRYIIGSK